ncbi:hypothetical protein DSO57_1033122 [Entomophthora muscae]|uniref:Uncharacterized protein n=1 Tax=Entomophthora muscae TaxID=34485 RepID=A0ACC2TAY5_9FUNG|nr:hypothetical protein DSO57_1033122 [Entomophthora muscae]
MTTPSSWSLAMTQDTLWGLMNRNPTSILRFLTIIMEHKYLSVLCLLESIRKDQIFDYSGALGQGIGGLLPIVHKINQLIVGWHPLHIDEGEVLAGNHSQLVWRKIFGGGHNLHQIPLKQVRAYSFGIMQPH